MKNILVTTALTLASIAVMASAPSAETAQIVRVLFNNDEIMNQLKDNRSTQLSDLQIIEVKKGVLQYTLTFKRVGFDMPSTAIVSIVEDVTPTFADGAIEYQSSVTFKDGK